MNEFVRYGHKETLSVGDMIKILETFDLDLPVINEWEGQQLSIKDENIVLADDKNAVSIWTDPQLGG